MKTALVIGIAGQDGSYLAEHLIAKGYKVSGLVRRNSVAEHQESRIDHLHGEVETRYADLQDAYSISKALEEIQPEFVYNLAAQSHVRISFDIPEFTASVNSLGAAKVLNSLQSMGAKTRFYQASSSEMFGDSVDSDGYQRESTPMTPVSPYGVAKLYAYHYTRIMRESYGMHASNGILFNHESPRRGSNFVTSKIVKTAVEIKFGVTTKLVLGNLDSQRDWGHSKDYVRAIASITEHEFAGDWVVATGQTRSVRDLCEVVFSQLGMNYLDYVVQDEKFMRPNELPYLRGDSSRIKKEIGWEPQISFDSLVEEMVTHWHDVLAPNFK